MCFCLSLLWKEFVCMFLHSLSLLILSLLDKGFLFGSQINNFFWRFDIMFVVCSNFLFFFFHLSQMFCFELLYWVNSSIFILLHILIPGRVELKYFWLLKIINRRNLSLLLINEFLFMSSHLLIFNFWYFLVSFLSFKILSCIFTLFSIILKKM